MDNEIKIIVPIPEGLANEFEDGLWDEVRPQLEQQMAEAVDAYWRDYIKSLGDDVVKFKELWEQILKAARDD